MERGSIPRYLCGSVHDLAKAAEKVPDIGDERTAGIHYVLICSDDGAVLLSIKPLVRQTIPVRK